MNFYVSLVFLGIILVALSLVLVILDRKKVFGITRNFDEKKQELVEIINDAEQMIEELNKFSDYIVTQMDLKNEELRVNLKSADEEIKNLAGKAQAIRSTITGQTAGEGLAAGYKPAAMEYKPAAVEFKSAAVEYKPAAAVNGGVVEAAPVPMQVQVKRSEKVIPMKNRYSEVLRLAETGMDGLDIARTLNMGKGEVELILGLNKN